MPELSVQALSVLPTESHSEYTLAIVHIDHMQRTQLISRDLSIKDRDLSFTLSPILPSTLLPANTFPDTDNPLQLVTIPSFAIDSQDGEPDAKCLGGVLVLGGRKIAFYEVASEERQKKQRSKDKRQSKRKASGSEKDLSLKKEAEKEPRKVKSKMSVKWPWSEVTA